MICKVLWSVSPGIKFVNGLDGLRVLVTAINEGTSQAYEWGGVNVSSSMRSSRSSISVASLK